MAITSWFDKGMVWTTEADIKEREMLQRIEAVRLAVVERLDAFTIASFSSFADTRLRTAVVANELMNHIGGAGISIFAAVEEAIDAFISSRWINYLDNSGNWENVSTIKLWTEADLLTSIGDITRIPITTPSGDACGFIPTAAWFLQQFKMLNNIIWAPGVNDTNFGINLVGSSGQEKTLTENFSVSWTNTYNNAVTSWNAAAGPVTAVHPDFFANTSFQDKNFGTDVAFLQRHSAEALLNGLYTGAQRSIDWYVKLQELSGTIEYLDQGLGITKNTLWHFATTAESAVANPSQLTDEFPNVAPERPTAEPSGPGVTEQGGCTSGTVSTFPNGQTAVKWDGANGFLFK